MRLVLIIWIMLFLSIIGRGQSPFNQTYGWDDDDAASGIIINSDSLLVITTSLTFNSYPLPSLIFLDSKFDSITSFTSTNKFWSSGYQEVDSLFYISTGMWWVDNSPSSDVDLFIRKVDKIGNVEYNKTYGGTDYDYGLDFIQIPDSGFLIAGATKSFGAGGYDIYLIRTEKDGDTIWTRTYGQGGYDEATGIEAINDSSFFVCGTTTGFGAQWTDVFVMKLDIDGDTSLLKVYGNAGNDVASAMVKTNDKGYAIAGWQLYNTALDGQFLLLKLDSNANQIFLKTYGTGGMDEAFDIKETFDHGFVLVGYSEQPGRGEDVYIVRTDSVGDTLWTKTLGGAYNDRAYSVVQTPDSGFAMVGNTYSYGAGGSDAFFLKLKPNGDITVSSGFTPELKDLGIRLYPNPARENITLDITNTLNQESELFIYNAWGQMIRSYKMQQQQSEISISLIGIKSGVYYCELRTNNKTIGTGKFVKE